ncbi:MAG: hypothetical protein K2M87_01685 [Muribaculaceae bacterium]|nr:hypothetical protein [Muribaculaceae bacterium]
MDDELNPISDPIVQEPSGATLNLPTSGFINGSDVLLAFENTKGEMKGLASCTEHTCNYESETKERATKAPITSGVDISMFSDVDVTGLKITISFKGLRTYDAEANGANGFGTLLNLWMQRKKITVECFLRPKSGVSDAENINPYLKATGIITKLTESSTAKEDASYDGEIRICAAPEIFNPQA